MKHLLVLFALALMLASQFCGAQTAYVPNLNDGTVSVINVAKNAVIGLITVGNQPYGVSVSLDGTKVYVTNYIDSTVSVINTATNNVTATIKVGAYPVGICVSPDGSKVFVANGDCTVSAINTFTNSVVAVIPVSDCPEGGIAISPDGSNVYVGSGYNHSVSVISTASNTVSATIDEVITPAPYGLAVSPDGGTVYIANGGWYGYLAVINANTNTVTTTIFLGNNANSSAVCVSPDGSRVYVSNLDNETVSVIDASTNSVSATISVGGYSYPYGVSVSPDGSKLYVATHALNEITVVNTATNEVTDTIPVGNNPCSFGNFISTYISPACRSYFSIYADTVQLHHYLVTDNSLGVVPLSYDWSWGDGSQDDTIPYPSHIYANAGFYDICLSIKDADGCQSTFCDSSFHAMRTTNTMVYVDVVDPLTTGMQTINSQIPQVFLYPNPATSTLTIHISTFHNEAATVSVMNMLGEIVQVEKLKWSNDININIKNLCAGIYFLQVKSESGSVVKRFIKE